MSDTHFYLTTRISIAAFLAIYCVCGCDDTPKSEGENTDAGAMEPDSDFHRDGPENVREDEPSCDDGMQTCSSEVPCGAHSICSNVMFPEAEGFFSAQCYPECQPDQSLSACCPEGSICVAFDKAGQSLACVETGAAGRQNLSLKLLPAGKSPNHQDVTFTGIKTNVGDQKIPLTMAYALESLSDFDKDGMAEEVVILEFEGTAGLLGTWVLQVTVPVDLWQVGELHGALWSDQSQFDAVLSKWVGQEMAVHAILREGTITVREPGVVCSKAPCTKTDIDIALQLIAIKAKWNSAP